MWVYVIRAYKIKWTGWISVQYINMNVEGQGIFMQYLILASMEINHSN